MNYIQKTFLIASKIHNDAVAMCAAFIYLWKCPKGYKANLKVNTVARTTKDVLETSLVGSQNL